MNSAKETPRAHLPDLAISLANYCIILSGLNRLEEALEVISEASKSYNELEKLRPGHWQQKLNYCAEVQEELIDRLNAPGRTTHIPTSVIHVKNSKKVYLHLAIVLGLLILIAILSIVAL